MRGPARSARRLLDAHWVLHAEVMSQPPAEGSAPSDRPPSDAIIGLTVAGDLNGPLQTGGSKPSTGPLGFLEPRTELRETRPWGYQALRAATKDANRQGGAVQGSQKGASALTELAAHRRAWVPEEEKDQKTVLLGLMEASS